MPERANPFGDNARDPEVQPPSIGPLARFGLSSIFPQYDRLRHFGTFSGLDTA